MIAEIVATLAVATFFGAAVYINLLVEHPARLSCAGRLAVTEWRLSYRRGTLLQAPLALIGSASALMAWRTRHDRGWMLGALLFGLVIPFTLVVILPTNQRLESNDLDLSSDEALRPLRRWGRLHVVRSVLSGVALLIFLLTLSGK